MKKHAFLLSFFCALGLFANFKEDFSSPESRKNLIDFRGAPEIFSIDRGVLAVKTDTWSRFHLYKAQNPADVDATFKVRFKKTSGGYAGIVLRNTNTDCGVGVSVTASQTHMLYQGPNDRKAEYFQVSAEKGAWHTVRVVLNGSKGRVYLNGKTAFDLEGLPTYGGRVFLRTWDCDVEFDDVELKPSLPIDVRNVVSNGSFEFDGAVKGVPAGWGIGGWGLVAEEHIRDLDNFNKLWTRTTENPAHGKYCMKVGIHGLFSSYFSVQAKQQYTLSAMLRADKPGRVRMLFVPWRAPEGDRLTEKYFDVGTNWNKITWTLPKTGASQAGIYFYRAEEDNTLYVDAVSVTAGSTAPAEYIADDYNPAKKTDYYTGAVKLKPGLLASAPKLNDTLDAAVWKNGTTFEMSDIAGGKTRNKAYGKIGYDANNIYIKCICEDPAPDKLVAKVKERDGHVWNDDSIELFIGPSGPRGDWADYFHLGVSVTGARYDARKVDPSWNKEWKAETRRTAKGYEVLITLPFAMFEINNFNLGDWTFNICREAPARKEYSAWSPTYGTFHNQEKFGLLSIPSAVLAKHASRSAAADNKSAVPTGVAKLNGESYFPFGFCWSTSHPGATLPTESAVKAFAAMGSNTIQWQVLLDRTSIEQIRDFLALAKKYDLKVMLWLDPCFGGKTKLYSPESVKLMRSVIAELNSDEAVASWMVFDEPHSHGDFVKKSTEELKKVAGDKITFINVTPQGLGMKIAGLPGDIMAFDRYAFGFDGSSIADIGTTAKSAAAAANNRPVWCFLMTGGNVLWMTNSPSAKEHVAQYYTALTNGVTGFIGFCNVPPSPETRAAIKNIADEFKVLLPKLYSGTPCDVKVSGNVSFIARQSGDTITIALVNPSEKTVNAEFILPENIKDCEIMFDNLSNMGKFLVTGNKLIGTFDGLERRVLNIRIKK